MDVDAIVRGRALYQANSGGGKSWALRQLLEETYGRVQQFVLDDEGEFSTLREKFDYVLAAKHGADVEASPRTAKLLCRRLMETGVSAIIDLYDHEINQRRAFVRLFLSELMALPKDLRRPLIVVLDEAHKYAPEGGHSEALESVVTLASQGRKRGYALVCATQRLSKLSKDVAAELNTKFIGRTGLDLDVKRAGDELGMDKEGRARLAMMEPGTFYVYGAAIVPAGAPRLVRTGAVKTSHPEAGAVEESAPPPPSAKVKSLIAKSMADLPAEAAQEARSIADYQKTIASLSQKLAASQRAKPTAVVHMSKAPDQSVIDKAVAAAVKPWRTFVEQLHAAFPRAALDISKGVDRLQSLMSESPVRVAPKVAKPEPLSHSLPRNPAPIVQRAPVSPVAEGEASDLTKPRQSILDTLASFEAMGITMADKSNVGVFAGQSPTSSGFANNLGALRSAGLIDYPQGGMVALTDSGREIARGEPIGSVAELHDRWKAKLPAPRWRIVDALIAAFPAGVSRAELAEVVQQSSTSSGYANNLGALRSLGLIKYSDGNVYATGLLFPEGM